jgi:hypothetical protein
VALAGVVASVGGAAAAPVAANSPLPEEINAAEAWRFAESVAACLPGGDVMIGHGDSMLPLYPNHTVIVVQRQSMNELRPGMTVVFIGDSGRPVAHTLVAKTSRGWTAQGVGNSYVDRTTVRSNNYLGTVVRAFLPVNHGPTDSLVALALAGDRTMPNRAGASD